MRPIRHLVGEDQKMVGNVYEEQKKDKKELIWGELDKNPFAISMDDTVGNDSINEKPRDFQATSYVRRVKTKLGMDVAPLMAEEDDFEEEKDADEPPEDEEEQNAAEEETETENAAEEEENETENAENKSFLDIEYGEIPESLTYDYLSRNITSFHDNVKRCLILHMRARPNQQRPYRQIVDDCVGPNALYLRRYYNDIVFLTRKFMTDSIMNKLALGFCDKDFNICVEYYRAIWLFAELNYNVKASLQANGEPLEELLGLQKLQFLYSLSMEFIVQYKQLRDQIDKERQTMNHLLRVRLQQYNMEYLPTQVKSEESSEEDSDNDNEPFTKGLPAQTPNDENDDRVDDTPQITEHVQDPLLKIEPRDDDGPSNAGSESEQVEQTVIDTRREEFTPASNGSILPSSPEELDRINEEAHALTKTRKKMSKVKKPDQKFK